MAQVEGGGGPAGDGGDGQARDDRVAAVAGGRLVGEGGGGGAPSGLEGGLLREEPQGGRAGLGGPRLCAGDHDIGADAGGGQVHGAAGRVRDDGGDVALGGEDAEGDSAAGERMPGGRAGGDAGMVVDAGPVEGGQILGCCGDIDHAPIIAQALGREWGPATTPGPRPREETPHR